MGKGLPRSIAQAGSLAPIKKQTILLRSVPISVLAVTTAVGWGTAVIGGLPEGNLLVHGAIANLTFTGTDANVIATWSGNFSLGSAATADFTLSGSEVDFISSTAVGPAVAKVSPTTRGANGTGFMLDNTDKLLKVNLNLIINAADIVDSTTAALLVTGEVYLVYTIMGDD